MTNVLMGLQIVLAVLMIVSVLGQDTKNAVPTQFGGEGSQAYFKPKGKEAFLGRVTKITAILFFLNAIALLLI